MESNNDVLKEIADHTLNWLPMIYDRHEMQEFLLKQAVKMGLCLIFQVNLFGFSEAYDYDRLLAYVSMKCSMNLEWPIFWKLLEKEEGEQFEQGINLILSKEAKNSYSKSWSLLPWKELTAIYGDMTPVWICYRSP